jgi:hypothetical protein
MRAVQLQYFILVSVFGDVTFGGRARFGQAAGLERPHAGITTGLFSVSEVYNRIRSLQRLSWYSEQALNRCIIRPWLSVSDSSAGLGVRYLRPHRPFIIPESTFVRCDLSRVTGVRGQVG